MMKRGGKEKTPGSQGGPGACVENDGPGGNLVLSITIYNREVTVCQ
jgi:hypothetical protein